MTEENIPGYVEGALFINHGGDFDEGLWSRDLKRYTPSEKAVARMMKLGGIINRDDVNHALVFGEMYPAAQGCLAFVTDLGGVALYIVVNADVRDSSEHKLEGIRPSQVEEMDFGPDDLDYRIVTIWPYVFDRDRAWGTGRWTGQQLDVIESIEPDMRD